jgi:predicted component of type VI protein secretion system
MQNWVVFFANIIWIPFLVSVLNSCSNSAEKKSEIHSLDTKKVNLDIIFFGLTEKVKYDLLIKSPYKSITQEDEISLKGDTVNYQIEVFSGSEIKMNVKTFDSFGPEVNLLIYVDNELWYSNKNSYQIELDSNLP